MHQQPPYTPLLRSTSSAKASHVEASSGRTVCWVTSVIGRSPQHALQERADQAVPQLGIHVPLLGVPSRRPRRERHQRPAALPPAPATGPPAPRRRPRCGSAAPARTAPGPAGPSSASAGPPAPPARPPGAAAGAGPCPCPIRPTGGGRRLTRAVWSSTSPQSTTGASSTTASTRSATHERETTCSAMAPPIDQPISTTRVARRATSAQITVASMSRHSVPPKW